ncbi:MFS transporter [Bacillus cereus]|nr:MFS transporter [Bacillus cereus]MCD2338629.1 MFS transporter [Bacillus cereus]MCD2338716.1 MFS transporter [Bacillus cereus]
MKGFYFFTFLGTGSLFPLLGLYLSTVEHLNGYQIGTIMSLGPIIMIFFQPIWGLLCDYTQKPRIILSTTVLLTGISGLGYLIFNEFSFFIFVALLIGVFQSAIIPISDSISLSYTSKTNGNYGNIRLFGSLGFGVAVFIMGRLSGTFIGPTVIFYGFFISLCIASFLAYRMPQEVTSQKQDLIAGLKHLIQYKEFLIFLLIAFMIFAPNLANNSYFGIFVENTGGTLTGIGIAFFLAVSAEIPFMKIANQWINKLGILNIVVLAGTASMIRWFLYSLEPSLWIVYASTIIQGFSLGLFIPAGLQYIRKIAPLNMGTTAVTLYSAIGNGVGNWFYTFFGGVLYEKFSIYAVYFFFGVVSLLGILLTFVLIKLEKNIKEYETNSSIV